MCVWYVWQFKSRTTIYSPMCPVITTTIRAQRALQCFLASVYMSLVVGFILRLQQLLNGYVNSFLSTIPPLLAARTPWTRCGQSVGVCFCAVSQSNICALEESYLSTLGVCVQFSSRRHSSLTFIFYILWSSVACRNCYFCSFFGNLHPPLLFLLLIGPIIVVCPVCVPSCSLNDDLCQY